MLIDVECLGCARNLRRPFELPHKSLRIFRVELEFELRLSYWRPQKP